MIIHDTERGYIEPLVVSPARAKAMLDCGTTRLYELISAGEIESFKDGKSRKVTVASIKARVERMLAEAQDKAPQRGSKEAADQSTEGNPLPAAITQMAAALARQGVRP